MSSHLVFRLFQILRLTQAQIRYSISGCEEEFLCDTIINEVIHFQLE